MSNDGSGSTRRPTKSIRRSIEDIKQLCGSTVEVAVGPNLNTFYVHEALVRGCSPFFDRVIDPHRKESRDRKIVLLHDERDIVHAYLYWIYRGILLPPPLTSVNWLPSDDLKYVQAWILGNTFLDFKFQNAVTDALFDRGQCQGRNIASSAINYAFQNTVKGAPIRRLLVDLYCKSRTHFIADWVAEEDIPHDFLVLAVRTLRRWHTSPSSQELKPSEYYVHG